MRWGQVWVKKEKAMTKSAKTKRANGSGSLRWVAKRQQYEHRITIGRTPDGKPLVASFYGKTQKEALSKSANRTSLVSLEGLPTNPTVKQWFEYCMNQICVTDGTKETTRIHKLRIANTYVLPYIGDIKLAALRASDVRSMLNELSKKAKSKKSKEQDSTKLISPQTQIHALKLTRQFLKIAVRH
jgi:hypothetical protein